MSRFIEDVHEQIIRCIPEEEADFRLELNDYINSTWNKAPEVRKSAETFIPYYYILSKYISSFSELNEAEPKWKFDIIDIFCNK